MGFFYNVYVKPAYGKSPKEGQSYKDMWEAGMDFYEDVSGSRFGRYFSKRDTLHFIQDGAILVVFPDGDYIKLEASVVERYTQET